MNTGAKQKLKAAVVILSVLLVMAGLVFYVADKSTKPRYDSKVDKLLFDTDNKSPKYIITLPDKTKSKKMEKAERKEDKKETPRRRNYDGLSEEEIKLRELVNNTPNLSKIDDVAAVRPLKIIEADSSLLRDENGLKIPAISEDGRKPWIEYAAESVSVQPNFSRVAVVVKNLGMDRRTTRAVITKFPAEVSLSFSPYGLENDELITEARKNGHETYVDLYLSSKDFLRSDSGPLAMSITADQDENKIRLKRTVSSPAAIGGVVINKGVADESNIERLKELFAEVLNMGLLFIDATGESGVDGISIKGLPRQKADIVIDHDYTVENIRRNFMQAELVAQNKGFVLVAVEPKPVVLQELHRWVNSFSPQYTYEEMKEKNITAIEKPFALIPLSEVVVEN